ncbi:MAG: NAD(P)H-dependent oxidoreductase [Opitutales bacterium TMED158]|nr:MAG: NAD(P)H-dependent oxidoreductase [Opitutales bacterium TMED158]
MATVTETDLLDQLKWRYAVKEFDPTRRISEETMQTLEEALVLTPSSFGLQPWKFIVIEDEALKERLPAVSWNQSQPKDCSHMVVLTIKRNFAEADVGRFIECMANARGVDVGELEGYRKFAGGFVAQGISEGWIEHWSTHQSYIALGQLMASAAMLGIDACPMEGIQADAYDEALGLDEYHTVLGCALGYRSSNDKYASMPKARYAKSEVIERR